ncbi:MAG TPA: hypothetical protein VFU94_11165 [Conexibacter sp.]|nr:hypothetical protein [Conexibacter sp.]
MLFDLQSRGRRTAVKIIYLGLAVLMGGGLLLFGIGTGTGQGGFFDIFKGNGSSTSAQVSSAETSATRQVRLHPQDPRAWYALTYARYQSAGYDNTLNGGNGGFTAAGRKKLASASTAWQRYLTLDPNHPNPTLARLMANAYSQVGLNQPADAATAMEIVTEQQPSEQSFAALAEFAYLANQLRKGDLAAARAVSLAPSAQQRLLRTNLANIRRQVTQRGGRSSGGSSGGVNGVG